MSNFFMKSSWGSDDPTRAAMVFGHGNALAKAGHQVRIFLLGEAALLAKPVIRDALFPVGWPALAEQWRQSVTLGIEIEICDACRIARGVSNEEISASGAVIGTPDTLVAGIEWADKVICE
jgi:sulfur relay (sulfurtransferase) complex TusBCD TusD component (DsrE family)